MKAPTLIVPGFHGSGPDHWQSWLQQRLGTATRLQGVDWEQPVLPVWTRALSRQLEQAKEPVWVVAHSFGCLTTIAAAARIPGRIAGVLLVAPASPERFTPRGVRNEGETDTLTAHLAHGPLPFPSLIVASEDDPWMALEKVEHWARLWHSPLVRIGRAGHINVDSGFGPWAEGLSLLRALQEGRLHAHPRRPLAPARSLPTANLSPRFLSI